MFTIKAARTFAGYSQAEMADKMGVARNTFSEKENLKRKWTFEEACNFADICGVPLDQIIFFESKSYENETEKE